MVVDDNSSNLKLLTGILTDRGYKVRPAADGEIALAAVAERKPELILLDIKMPGMNGYEVCRRLKEDKQSKAIPVIFISALASPEDRIKGFEVGGVDYITKPFQHQEVMARVDTHLQLYRMQKKHEQLVDERTAELREAYQSLQKSEAETRASEKKYRTLFESTKDAIMVMDEKGFIDCNRATLDIFGCSSREQILGSHPADWSPPTQTDGHSSREAAEEKNGIALKQGYCFFTWTHRRASGEDFPAEVLLSPMEIDGRQVIQGIIRDISDRRQAEEEKVKLETQLQHAQKVEAIGTLASGIAHDFNNILSAILGFAEFIVESNPEESKTAEDARQIIGAANRASELVKQILSFSRHTEVSKEVIQPYYLVKEAMKMLRATLPTSISMEQYIDPDCGTIMANPSAIHQVVVNLCTNARQAMSDDKGVLRMEIKRKEVSAAEIPMNQNALPGCYLMLTVSDSGCGIGKEALNRIFEPYFTTKEKGEGTGLGLAVVHGIVQGCNGFIRVSSEVDRGTRVSVYFPTYETAADELVAKDISPRKEKTKIQARIMLVDDEPLLVHINKRRLEEKGYQVKPFTSSRKALEAFRKQPDSFDLLITDQTMPKFTGEELAKAILEIRPSLPIILCTGHSDIVPKERAESMGITKYVLKPLHEDELLQSVEELLG